MMVSLQTLLTVAGVIVLPGAAFTANLLVRVAKLEAEGSMRKEHLDRIEQKLDRLIEKTS